MEIAIILSGVIITLVIIMVVVLKFLSKKNSNKQNIFRIKGNIYKTDKIKIEVIPEIDKIEYRIHNLGQTPIKLIWDESCILLGEKSYKIYGSDTQLIGKKDSIKPSTIIPLTSLSNGFSPTDVIQWYTSESKWIITPWLKTMKTRAGIRKKCNIVFCLEIENKKEYITLVLEHV